MNRFAPIGPHAPSIAPSELGHVFPEAHEIRRRQRRIGLDEHIAKFPRARRRGAERLGRRTVVDRSSRRSVARLCEPIELNGEVEQRDLQDFA